MIMLTESDESKHNSIRNLQLTKNHKKTEIVVSFERSMIEQNWEYFWNQRLKIIQTLLKKLAKQTFLKFCYEVLLGEMQM